jgi:hypothetical protein
MLTFRVPLVATLIDGELVNVAGLAGGANLLADVPAPLQPVAVKLLPDDTAGVTAALAAV